MKNRNSMTIIGVLIIIALSLISGCSNNDQLESLPKTMAALTQQAMYVQPVTYTPAPTNTPTLTPVPSNTPTITITPTPDFTNFSFVTPAAAQVNTAIFKGVNFKFVKSEVSEVTRPMDPNSTTGREESFGRGKKTANLYFMTDLNDMYKRVVNTNTYISVTFSDGTTESVFEGYEKKGGALKGFYASEKTDTVGEVYFAFGIPKEGMEITQLKIAETVDQKDKAVVLYQK